MFVYKGTNTPPFVDTKSAAQENGANRILPPRVAPVPRSSSVPCAKLQIVRGQRPRVYNAHNLVLNKSSLKAEPILLFCKNERNAQNFFQKSSSSTSFSLPQS